MKMRPGPKAYLIVILACGLVGFGFWAGRGFPRTWDGVWQNPSATGTSSASSISSRRLDALEGRVNALEQEVATLRVDVNASHVTPPVDSAPPTQPMPPPSAQPDNYGQ